VRRNLLADIVKGLTEMKEELCDALSKDLGKTRYWSYLSEIRNVIDAAELNS